MISICCYIPHNVCNAFLEMLLSGFTARGYNFFEAVPPRNSEFRTCTKLTVLHQIDIVAARPAAIPLREEL